jgi:CHAD domain-containing protein
MLQFFKRIDNEPVFSIHGIRKQSKFMRSLLNVDREKNIQSIVILRNINKILSPYRDSQVMLETYKSYLSSSGTKPDQLVEELLSANPFFEDPIPDMMEMSTLNDLTDQLKIELENYSSNTDKEQFEAYILSRINATGDNFKKIHSASDSESLHAWRKKVKQVWYLLRFKYGEGESKPGHIIYQYDKLGEILGKIHDVDMLSEFILARFKKFPIDHILNYRAKFLDSALTMGAHVYRQD